MILLLVLTAAGCQSFEGRFSAIESRQDAIEAQLADLQSQQETLISRLVQVRQELDNALQPLRNQSADRGENLRSMEREVAALEEQIAQASERIDRLTEQLAAGPGRATDQPAVGTPMPPPRGGRAGRESAPSEGRNAPPDSEAATLFNSAFNDYLRQSYGLCIQGFQEYIRRYETSDRADDALYWVGECQAAQGDTRAARTTFERLIQDHPASDKIPVAMFRDAVILSEEGQPAVAAEAFRRVIQAYPGSDSAFLACGQLDRLGEAKPAACEEMD